MKVSHDDFMVYLHSSKLLICCNKIILYLTPLSIILAYSDNIHINNKLYEQSFGVKRKNKIFPTFSFHVLYVCN